jgi:hypothetical protein
MPCRRMLFSTALAAVAGARAMVGPGPGGELQQAPPSSLELGMILAKLPALLAKVLPGSLLEQAGGLDLLSPAIMPVLVSSLICACFRQG